MITSAVQLLDLQRDVVIEIVERNTEHTTECPNPQELLLTSTTEQKVVPLLGDHCKTVLPNTVGALYLIEITCVSNDRDILSTYLDSLRDIFFKNQLVFDG